LIVGTGHALSAMIKTKNGQGIPCPFLLIIKGQGMPCPYKIRDL